MVCRWSPWWSSWGNSIGKGWESHRDSRRIADVDRRCRCGSSVSVQFPRGDIGLTPTIPDTDDPCGLSAEIVPVLVQDLDEETARGAEVERPGPVEFLGRPHVESAGLQALVDLVHPLPTLLHEADVEGAGIFDLG